jgi:hypothetical protein
VVRSIEDARVELAKLGIATRERGEWLPWLTVNAETLGFKLSAANKLMAAATKFVAGYEFGESEALEISRLIWGHGGTSQRTAFTGNYEWYTPAE